LPSCKPVAVYVTGWAIMTKNGPGDQAASHATLHASDVALLIWCREHTANIVLVWDFHWLNYDSGTTVNHDNTEWNTCLHPHVQVYGINSWGIL